MADPKDNSKNPFKTFLDNLSDKSRGFAQNFIKEKDELITKFKEVTTPKSGEVKGFGKSDKEAIGTQTEGHFIEESEHQGDYLSNLMKISQLSQELSLKNEYLSTAETKISSLKSELQNAKSDIVNLSELATLHKENSKKVAEEFSKSATHMSFLEVENAMLKHQTQRLLKK